MISHFLFVFVALVAKEVVGHGMMLQPVNRASRWRFDPTAPIDYDDNQSFCGGAYASNGVKNETETVEVASNNINTKRNSYLLGFKTRVFIKAALSGLVIIYFTSQITPQKVMWGCKGEIEFEY
ncbi:hypothetical protein NQ317_016538 [Molorchus minor]|uniref:Uncharacterized protein n=1 Tax=Molorchus minor TaxID=1323400 RepID=A0ABQ9IW60_9CUCU|nr:hypothetical protein NQ317_016538 [Molorchus minor]